MATTAGDICQSAMLMCLGGYHGSMMLCDVRSKTLVNVNYEAHRDQVISVRFLDKYNAIVSVGKNCQVCLWSMQNLELLQDLRDYHFGMDYFNAAHVDPRRLALFCATIKMKTYYLRRNTEVVARQQQAEQLVTKSKQQMNLELLRMAQSSTTDEAKGVERELERSLKHQHTYLHSGLKGTMVNQWHRRAVEHLGIGSVLMSAQATLIHFDTNWLSHMQDRRNPLRLFTVDAGFLLRIWDLSFEHKHVDHGCKAGDSVSSTEMDEAHVCE